MGGLPFIYWAKVMKTIIDEYRENRDISANFNEILFETKYRVIFRDIYCSSCHQILPSRERYFVTRKRNFVTTQRNIVHTQWQIVVVQRNIVITRRKIITTQRIIVASQQETDENGFLCKQVPRHPVYSSLKLMHRNKFFLKLYVY